MLKKIHSNEEYKEIINNTKDKLIVIDFFATWCGPCKYIAPIFADLSEKLTNIAFLKVDVDEVNEISQEEEISAMPTFLFYKNGEIVHKIVGADIDEINKTLDKFK